MQAQSNDYTYYCYGNCTSPINVQSYPGFLLVGGSTDVDNALKKFIQNSGGGDILVLRASGSDGYNKYLYDLEKCNSVSSIVFHNKQASSNPFVLEKIEKASGIFFAGGDQSLYWKYWKDTPVETKVNEAITNRNVPIGGTSAGMAIQTQYIYTGEFESSTSRVVLRNPYDRTVTIEHDLLINPFFVHTICDQHFFQRDRMGRLLVFLARCMKDNGFESFKGIACDESTSLFQSGNVGTIYAHYPNERSGNFCYFLEAQAPPTVCQVDTPLTLHNVTVYRLSNQQLFDFNAWRPLDQLIAPYSLNVNDGVISSTQSGGSIY